MKKLINAVILMLTALLLVINAQAQTAPSPTPVRVELAKEGEASAIKYTIKQGETKKFVASLLKDKYLYVYFLDPSQDNAGPSTVKVDSAQSTYAGMVGTTNSNVLVPKAKVEWEVTNSEAKKIFAGTDVRIEHAQVPADGDYYITLKCVTGNHELPCEYWLRLKFDKNPPPVVTVDFP